MDEPQMSDTFDLVEESEAELPQRSNPLSFLVGIWVRPRKTLEQAAEHPGWHWLIPMILVALLTAAQVWVTAPIQQQMTQEQIEKMMQQQREEIQKTAPKGQMAPEIPETPPPSIPLAPMIILGVVTGTFGLIIIWLVRAGVLHLLAMALGGRHRFGQMFAMTAWASMPTTLRQIEQIAYSLFTHRLVQNPGLSWLVSKPTAGQNPLEAATKSLQNPLIPLLREIDIFTIWYLVLLFVGIGVTARLSRKKTAVVWVIYLLLAAAVYVLPALAMKAVAGRMAVGF